MIAHDYRAMFVHVPKTAGQSVEMAFLNLAGLSWEERGAFTLRQNQDRAIGPTALAHLLAAEYVALGHMEQAAFDSYFKFSFVRNPWDRLVSEYLYRKADGRMPFSRFVREGLALTDIHLDRTRHMLPQTDYLYDDEGRLLVDFVGRFETLQRDFAQVAKRLDLPELELPHRNMSRPTPSLWQRLFGKRRARQPYQTYYTESLREQVAEHYTTDIERFGYAFDGSFSDHLIADEPTAEEIVK